MKTKTKLLVISSILSAALFLNLPASEATTKVANRPTITKIRVNGLSADMFLVDGDTNGFLNVGRDQIANTTMLDFSYATPDAVDPDIVILVQGFRRDSEQRLHDRFGRSPPGGHDAVPQQSLRGEHSYCLLRL